MHSAFGVEHGQISKAIPRTAAALSRNAGRAEKLAEKMKKKPKLRKLGGKVERGANRAHNVAERVYNDPGLGVRAEDALLGAKRRATGL